MLFLLLWLTLIAFDPMHDGQFKQSVIFRMLIKLFKLQSKFCWLVHRKPLSQNTILTDKQISQGFFPLLTVFLFIENACACVRTYSARIKRFVYGHRTTLQWQWCLLALFSILQRWDGPIHYHSMCRMRAKDDTKLKRHSLMYGFHKSGIWIRALFCSFSPLCKYFFAVLFAVFSFILAGSLCCNWIGA